MDTINKDKKEFIRKEINQILYYESTFKKIVIISIFAIIFCIVSTNLFLFIFGLIVPDSVYLLKKANLNTFFSKIYYFN